jgi:hypothetical protein
MSVVEWIILAVVGKLTMFSLRKALSTAQIENKIIRELIGCDFCLGVWIYSILSLVFNLDAFGGYIIYIPIINNIVTGIFTSFVIWIFSDGWKARFEVIRI